ncbi:unnamed protein product [Prorocentrum cordatum]|uniref:Uncharacterized protein n=1 Tax=Prorocentrum cordatum TaxID=2364126 RepID=A0ABN9RR96_9DINO|nr:unnamed protein product [Polarella glacialis]|mmetsp:Transcript_115453/g.313407  ORF Transcript_115453/g.313407 Transcript_115453/m.313407 type:complete len:511 (-) Transcript_115453:191-1723(-)
MPSLALWSWITVMLPRRESHMSPLSSGGLLGKLRSIGTTMTVEMDEMIMGMALTTTNMVEGGDVDVVGGTYGMTVKVIHGLAVMVEGFKVVVTLTLALVEALCFVLERLLVAMPIRWQFFLEALILLSWLLILLFRGARRRMLPESVPVFLIEVFLIFLRTLTFVGRTLVLEPLQILVVEPLTLVEMARVLMFLQIFVGTMTSVKVPIFAEDLQLIVSKTALVEHMPFVELLMFLPVPLLEVLELQIVVELMTFVEMAVVRLFLQIFVVMLTFVKARIIAEGWQLIIPNTAFEEQLLFVKPLMPLSEPLLDMLELQILVETVFFVEMGCVRAFLQIFVVTVALVKVEGLPPILSSSVFEVLLPFVEPLMFVMVMLTGLLQVPTFAQVPIAVTIMSKPFYSLLMTTIILPKCLPMLGVAILLVMLLVHSVWMEMVVLAVAVLTFLIGRCWPRGFLIPLAAWTTNPARNGSLGSCSLVVSAAQGFLPESTFFGSTWVARLTPLRQRGNDLNY